LKKLLLVATLLTMDDKYKQLKEDFGMFVQHMDPSKEVAASGKVTDLTAFEIPVSWEDLRSTHVITYDACDILETFTKAAESDRLALVADNTERTRLASAFTAVCEKTEKKEVLQKTLALAWRAMTESQKLIFHPNAQKTIDITKYLLNLLNRSKDEYILGKSACIISKIIQAGFAQQKQITTFNSWLLEKMMDSNDDLLVDILVGSKNALYNKKFQELFVKSHGASMHLYKTYLKHPNHRQIIYLVVFCYWLLTFDDKNHTHERLIKPNLFQMLVRALSDRLKPKIVRVALMFFQNLLSSKEARELMVMKGLVNVLNQLKGADVLEKWNDADMKDSLDELTKTLSKDVKQLSSFEQYEKEIRTGQLQKGPVHSTAFWKTNAVKFEKKEFWMIKELIKLLAVVDDAETVATALYDLGEFSKYYPRGRELLDTLGGRPRILYHLSNENKQIQEQALLAVQKLLVKSDMSARAKGNNEQEIKREFS